MSEQTQEKLEYKLLFSLVVAGKSADFAQKVMSKFLSYKPQDMGIMHFVNELALVGSVNAHLFECKSGNYAKLTSAFTEIAGLVILNQLDLKACTAEDLEKIKGIGPKTSRFFILWTRPDARHAALDTHILKWLRYLGYDAPMFTPSNKKYAELEVLFLAEADKRKIKPAALDTMIWEYCRDGLHKSGEWPNQLQKI